ncbi:MAG TPA: PKD domain-containing protein [Bacteroidia bacterium]|nr:PKD domain-containing protein [Bacteroidia bacterium]
MKRELLFRARSVPAFLFFLLLVFFSSHSHAQVFWTEDFGVGCSQNQQAGSYTGPNGTWTVTQTGTNGTSANDWFISATEAGMGAGNCGSGCLTNGTLTNRTLHVASLSVPLICPTGDCGAAYNAGPSGGNAVTDKRAESPVINCSGQTTITLSFVYMEAASPPNDQCTVWYFDGTTWSLLSTPGPSNNTGCSGQGKWTAYSTPLPASADNNPNVKIGFHWVNNDDGAGNDPSFAVDDVTLSASASATPPTAAFTASATNVCVGTPVNFTDNSTGGPTGWSWTFPGGTPPSSTSQNVTGVVWNTAGSYTVTLTATNANGSNSTTQVITVNPPPTVTASANPSTVCPGNPSTLTGAGASTYVWNPGNLSGTSVSVSPGATTTYTVIGTSAAGCVDSSTVTVTVQPCNVPQVNFIASDTSICVGDCINFTDLSTNGPTSWSWSFSGASVPSSTQQNPTNICYNAAGTYAVTLVATNPNGNGSLTKTGYIIVNPPPTANAGSDVSICTGQQTTLIGSGGSTYLWNPGNHSGSTFTVNPASTTTYTLTVTDANGCTGTDQVVVNVAVCTVPVAAFSANDHQVCEGTCIDFTDNSTGTPTGWTWSFPGAVPSSSTQQNPTNICYNTPGNYNVTLIVTNAFGSDTTVMSNYVSVGAAPNVDAGNYTTIAIGNSTQLNATGGTGTWSWVPSAGLSSPNIPNPLASPTVTTTYTVTLTDAFGCSVSDTVTVDVVEAYSLYLPSAFSPNGDGANDVYYVRGAGIKTLDFIVFDRFGEKVFESTSVNDGWDGTFRGKDCETGIYVYYVKAEFYNATSQEQKGDISLVR